jgi:serine/threonine-protein kinase
VPGVIGETEGDATAILQEQGFGVAVEEVIANFPDEEGIVLDQDPGGGAEVEPGTTVTIFVGRFPIELLPDGGQGQGGDEGG